MLDLFVRAMGAGTPSSRLDVWLGDRQNALAEVVRLTEDAGAAVSSVMTLVDREGRKEAVLRLATINPGPAVKALEARGYTVTAPWRG